MRSAASLALAALALSALTAVGAADSAPPAAAPPAVAPATPEPTLDGIWLFDAQHSDDPREVMEKSGFHGRGGSGHGGHGGMGGGPRGGGMGGPPGGMGGPPDGEPVESGQQSQATNSRGGGDPRRAMERVLHPAKKMVVYVDRDRFQIEEDEGAPRVYTISDSLKALGVKQLKDEAVVRFKGRNAEATQPLGERGALVETFELSADGHTLTIRAQRRGGPEGMPNPVITRVYTRYNG